MKTYTIMQTHGMPDWSSIPILDVSEHLWLPSASVSMTAQICYDAKGFYVHMKAVEANVRAVLREPLSPVCEDSCMEWFFCPQETDGRYLNFEINPNGCMFIGIGHGRSDGVRLCPSDEETLFQKKTQMLSDGWEVFYTVPVSFLQVFFPDYEPTSGSRLRANCYKCGDRTVSPHYLAWNPIDHPTPDFHRPCDFGVMFLE